MIVATRLAALPSIALLFIPCAFLTLILCRCPAFLMSSDSLFPAEFTWAVTHHLNPWAGFQQPRVPSFFPDLVVYGGIQIVTGSWRIATVVWVFLMLGWLAVIMRRLAAGFAGSGGHDTSLPIAVLLLLVLGGAALGLPKFALLADSAGPFFPWLFILVPYTHGGPFLLAITVACLAHTALKRPTPLRMACLALLSGALSASDELALVSLLGPLTTALLCGVLLKTIDRAPALRVVVPVWSGAALGAAAAARLLDRQPLPLPSPAEMLSDIGGFATEVERNPVLLIVLLCLVSALAREVRRRGVRGFLGDFWLMFAATGALGSIAVTMLLYCDIWSFRYALPALWLTFAFVPSAMTEIIGRWRGPVSWCACFTVVAGLLLVWPARGLLADDGTPQGSDVTGSYLPRLFGRQAPLVECLRRAGLRAGLADFWTARTISAGSDWQLQVEPIYRLGEALVWGNDPSWFERDIHDVTRPPAYQFIVMDRLVPDRIAALYGRPDRAMKCDASTVWLYDDPDSLLLGLRRASPSLATTFAVAPTR